MDWDASKTDRRGCCWQSEKMGNPGINNVGVQESGNFVVKIDLFAVRLLGSRVFYLFLY